jgi:hypothetical protein
MNHLTGQRIKKLDACFAEGILAGFVRGKERSIELISREPADMPQSRHSYLAGEYAYIGLLSYALGRPFHEVREAFLGAAKSYLTVFELRGTESPFPVTDLVLDPTKAIKDPAFVISSKGRHSPGAKDYSVTNSKTAFEAVSLALVARDYALAERLANLIWDPPNATYVGPHSEVCTLNEQHLGYAIRELVAGADAGCVREASQITWNKIESDVFCLGKMVRAIAEGIGETFLVALRKLLEWHDKQATRKENLRNPEWYLSLRGLGAGVLAVRRQVLRIEELPDDNPYLPLELMT